MTTKAIKLALAYVYATGRTPTHIRLATWSAVQALTVGHGADKSLTPEGVALIDNHPMKIAHDFVTSRGFKRYANFRRSSSHYVTYRKFNEQIPLLEDEATIFRHGGANIRTAMGSAPSELGGPKLSWRNASYSVEELNDWYKETRK